MAILPGGSTGVPSSPDADNIASPLSTIAAEEYLVAGPVSPLPPAVSILPSSSSVASQATTVSYAVDGVSTISSSPAATDPLTLPIVSLNNSIAAATARLTIISDSISSPDTPVER